MKCEHCGLSEASVYHDNMWLCYYCAAKLTMRKLYKKIIN